MLCAWIRTHSLSSTLVGLLMKSISILLSRVVDPAYSVPHSGRLVVDSRHQLFGKCRLQDATVSFQPIFLHETILHIVAFNWFGKPTATRRVEYKTIVIRRSGRRGSRSSGS
jgi:hypothetical protein